MKDYNEILMDRVVLKLYNVTLMSVNIKLEEVKMRGQEETQM